MTLGRTNINRLMMTASRNPVAEGMVAWTSIWVFLTFLVVACVPQIFQQNGVILLERVGAVLIVAGIGASFVSWVFIRIGQWQVTDAKKQLRKVLSDHKFQGDS